MTEREVHLELSNIKIDNDNLDYIKMTGEICGKLRDDLVKLFAIPDVSKSALLDEWNNGYCRGCEDTHSAYKDQMG
jgi:hypothetical protein